ncbi:hypothetical protein [Streptomyces sp. NPDC060366]|uniref:hypothetical protein n=1 Tax=Streptomyces sp. NPDC060366 TaxID=3347105 RepID=UPI00364A60D6
MSGQVTHHTASAVLVTERGQVLHLPEVPCPYTVTPSDTETPPDKCPQCGTIMTVNGEGAWVPA